MPMDQKVIAGCAFFSVLTHAAIGLSFYPVTAEHDAPVDRSVTISYLSLPPEAPERVQPAAAFMPPVSKAVPKALVQNKPASAVRQTPRTEPLKFTSAYQPTQRSMIRDSAEILRDPKDGKVFTSYFGTVKEKIYQVIRRKYPQQNVTKGSVTLIFILDRSGQLENVWVADKQTAADAAARDFAVRCLKGAAPFPPFPRELNIPKITFNVTVVFEDL